MVKVIAAWDIPLELELEACELTLLDSELDDRLELEAALLALELGVFAVGVELPPPPPPQAVIKSRVLSEKAAPRCCFIMITAVCEVAGALIWLLFRYLFKKYQLKCNKG